MKVLEIGCGIHRRGETTVAIDKIETPCTDIVRDVAVRGIPFADNTFEKVIAYDVIEHVEFYDDLIFLFNEIWRVLEGDGMFEFVTPAYPQSIRHLTHHRFFFPDSFAYLEAGRSSELDHMRRSDGIVANFKILFDEEGDEYWIRGRFRAKK